MNRVCRIHLPYAATLVSALALSGCFNNMSGLDSGASRSSQSNTTLNDSGFANETGPIDTAAVLIGAYRDTQTPTDTGLLIDLQKSLLGTLGATSLQSILDTIDTNTTMQARPVSIHIAGYGIKATTTLGAIAAGNNKKLRNIMNIRPRMKRIDLTTSALDVPSSPAVLQLNNSNYTVVTYGGMIEGSFVRRMTTMITYAGANGSFLPSASIPTWGDGYLPSTPPETTGSVKLIPVNLAIATLFANLMKAPQDQSRFTTAPDSVKNILQTYGSMALAVHLKVDANGNQLYEGGIPGGVDLIDAAYFVNINPAVTAGPEYFPFCHSGYNSQDLTIGYSDPTVQGQMDQMDYTHPLACNCNPMSQNCNAQAFPVGATTPQSAIFVDTWPTDLTKQKAALIKAQIQATTPPSVVQLIITGTTTVNGFTLVNE